MSEVSGKSARRTADITVAQFADVLKVTVDKLRAQLEEAGIQVGGPDDVLSENNKMQLLNHLNRRHGKTESAPTTASPRKITLQRKSQSELKLTPGAAYVHITANNTIEGTEWKGLPELGDAPLVSDASSNLFSRPIDISKYGLIYAGAQKNLGPSGTTLVIIREDLLARSTKSLHTMLNYAVHAENGSLYNTPPCFAIYNLGLVMRWLLGLGGLTAIAKINDRKAGKLYANVHTQLFPGGEVRGQVHANHG